MWVHHHTHTQPTQDIHPPSTTTTNTAANQQPQPPTTNNQLGDQASKQVNQAEPSPPRAPVLFAARAPGCVL